MYEMSFLLPQIFRRGREVDRAIPAHNPMWINPDGFYVDEATKDEHKIKCHAALTPTWE